MRRRVLLNNNEDEIGYSNQYLTIVSLADNNRIGWKHDNSNLGSLFGIYVSTDEGLTWTVKSATYSGTTLATLNNGKRLLIKHYNTEQYGYTEYAHFTSKKDFNVEGNIMSMTTDGDFTTADTLGNAAFRNIFFNCTNLKSAENLVLPATTLADNCYSRMFYGCTSLTTAPSLPATTLAYRCYEDMFYGCSSLTTAPELPATNLEN